MKRVLILFSCLTICADALTPEQERASFRLADDSLRVELVASEPNVISPVAIAWDSKGRMFAAEMIDYPVGPGSGQIRMLEDLDGDGVYEKATVFADNLHFPNGVLPWKDGLLVTSAPNILFLRDTDGDGHADERRVILTGFAEGNQQLRVNGLYLGLDGWIYGANGRSDGELRRPDQTTGLSLRGHDFRFKPDTGEFEAIAGRSQFGLGHDDWGNRFLSWNTIAIRHEVIPERFLTRNPNIPVTEAIHDLAPTGDKGEVFPLTPTPLTFNNESTSHFNALAGLTIYRGNALPAYYGNAFMGETLRNLVHRRVLEPDGPTFVARRVEQGREFLGSTDPWFHPVNFATGPDGALYIVDFYRQWVEHPGYVPEKLRGTQNWRTGAEHGRVWRVRPRDWKRPALTFTNFANVSLLKNPNGWVRDTAFRSLLDTHGDKTSGDLFALLANKNEPDYSRVAAFHLLSNFDAIENGTLLSALRDSKPRVRESVLRVIAARQSSPNALPLLDDPDAGIRLWAVLALGKAGTPTNTLEALARLATCNDFDAITAVAVWSITDFRQGLLVEQILRMHPSAREPLLGLIRHLADDAVKDLFDRRRVIASIIDTANPTEADLACLAGFMRSVGNTEPSLTSDSFAQKFLPLATKVGGDPAASETARSCALQVVAFLARRETSPTILSFLLPPHPESVQRAAAKALMYQSDQIGLFARALEFWDRYQIGTRRQLLAGATRSSEDIEATIGGMKDGRIAPSELDPFLRQTLLNRTSGKTKRDLENLLGPPVSPDRDAVVKKYSAALNLSGDSVHGRTLFEKACAQCHTFPGFAGQVGPNLSGIRGRPKETLLVDILDPSRQVPTEFLNYTIDLTDSESLSGLLVAENETSLTVRRPNFPDETVPRSRVKTVRAGKTSLMPDGLDQNMSIQDMADLLQYLVQP